HSPVVAIAGGPAFGHYYKDAFQELDLLSMFKPVTKLAIQVNKPDRIPEILHYALRSAMTGRKGPVFIDIPRDILNNHVLQTDIAPPEAYRPDYPQLPHPEAIREAVRLLQQADRPLMLVGGGITWAGANDLAVRVSEQYALPMITAYGRNDAVPNSHPHYLGPLGRAGSPEAAAACRRADLLLVVGSRLGNFTTYYDQRSIQPGPRLVQIDIHSRPHCRPLPFKPGPPPHSRRAPP